MKLRIIAPVAISAFNASTLQVYAENARPDVEVSVVDLECGPASIECIFEESLAVPQIITRTIQAEKEGMDAVIINCMNDPGLEAAREVVSIPVIGAAQSAMLLAAMLAHNFSIVGTAPRDVFPNERLVRRYGLMEKYASTRSVDIPVLDLDHGWEKLRAALVEESIKATLQDGAHAIVLGCTGMRGMSTLVEKALREGGLDTVVIDPSLAALKWAEMLVDLRYKPSRRTYPGSKEKLLDEHLITDSPQIDIKPGEFKRNARVQVLVPVIRGYRPTNWLEEGSAAYEQFARPGTQIKMVAIDKGPITIETHYLKAMAVPGLLRLTRKAQNEGATACIIDCMSDPGLDALREFAKIPVIGPAHASAFVAASLGHSFSILGTMNEMGHKFISQMQEYGIAEKLASVRTTGLSVQQVETEPDLMFPAMIREAEKAVDQDGAHVLIPGCTGMIGIAARLQEALEKRNIYVPVLEGPAIGVKVAEMLTDLNLSQSKVTYPFPPPKDLRGYEDLETRL